MANPERILALATKVVEARQQLASLEKEFAALVGEAPAQTVVIRRRGRPAGSTPSKVLALLEANPSGLSPTEISAQMPSVTNKYAMSILLRLAKKGQAQKLAKGRYGPKSSGA